MHRLRLILVTAFVIFSNPSHPVAAKQNSASDLCEQYAARKSGKNGVVLEEIDPKVAIPACERAVRLEPNSDRLIYELGRAYFSAHNFVAAIAQYQKAAKHNYPPALNAVGAMYYNGLGVTKDEREAVKWYRKAAEKGDMDGQFNLGLSYEKGTGVRQDYGMAFGWYSKSAAQGAEEAQDSLGYFYAKGVGTSKDDVLAAAWFRKAAEQGMAGAQFNLATMYEKGNGVAKDERQAMYWYKRSSEQGNDNAKNKLRELNPHKPSADLPTSDATDIKRKAAASCRYSSEADIEDCYWEALKNFRGLPQKLVNSDPRDAVAYCNHVAESNDSQFCADLRTRFPKLFESEENERHEAAERELQREKIEDEKRGKFTSVTALAVSVVPGAVICPDLDTTKLMFHLYVNSWTDTQQDVISHGQSRLVRGQPTPAPNLKLYGCALAPPGTRMLLERGNIAPVVRVTLPNGTPVRGVTLPSMFVERKNE